MVSRFPAGLGTDELRRQENKVKVIPGYMYRSGWHISFHLSIPTSALAVKVNVSLYVYSPTFSYLMCILFVENDLCCREKRRSTAP